MKKQRGNFTLAQSQEMVNKADKDGDGKINIAGN
jgi:Ca2+-binding EF-hand superfamily protein